VTCGSGNGWRVFGLGCCLLVVLSLQSLQGQDAGSMTDSEILDELTTIIERQQMRLTEAEQLLTEQKQELTQLKTELIGLRESYTRLTETLAAHRTYSQSLESALRRLRVQRSVLLTISGISTVAAVVGWLM